MQCHYEVLALAKDANDDDIKRSYRKLALKFHPDKNPDKIDECTKKFHLIQQAYEVLIDPQERAWYDKHREAILKGGLGHGDSYQDDCLDVYKYFNTSVFSGYGDGEKGFYAVYKEVFKTISTEDSEYNDDSDWEVPEFGDSTSSYEETVGPFYGYWESYCTLRSYVWEEKYDTRDAPHRQVRRAMEQENKKLRDKAKRERNDEVRALVAFVKKRDKRVQAQKKKLEERAVEVAKLAKEKKDQQRRERLKSLEGYKETEWSSMSALEKDLKQLEASCANEFGDKEDSDSVNGDCEVDQQEESDEEDIGDIPYCVVCNRIFKSEKALLNHEKSKKHKENLAFLKMEMEEEEEALQPSSEELPDLEVTLSDLELSDTELIDSIKEEKSQKLSKKQKKKRRKQQKQQEFDPNGDTSDSAGSDSNSKEEITHTEVETISDDVKTESAECNDDSTQARNDIDTSEQQTEEKENIEVCEASSTVLEQEPANSNSCKNKYSNKQTGEVQYCNVCNQRFPSRNKLFGHIKKTGHALRVTDSDNDVHVVIEKKSKKKKKGKK